MTGWTRAKIAAHHKRQAEKRHEYDNNPKIVAARQQKIRERRERITATGMLLDANWSASRQLFVKSYRDVTGIWHQEFFKEDGTPCTMDGYIV